MEITNGQISFNVRGVKKTFTEEQIITALQEHGNIPGPTEGVRFNISPLKINRYPFYEAKKDEQQENTRQAILKAFESVDRNPQKYGDAFYTIRPEKTWEDKTVKELIELTNMLGGHVADEVEHNLELAQRIDNGESWIDVCNKPDTSRWLRLIMGNNGLAMVVGGSSMFKAKFSASHINIHDFGPDEIPFFTVPLIVCYE